MNRSMTSRTSNDTRWHVKRPDKGQHQVYYEVFCWCKRYESISHFSRNAPQTYRGRSSPNLLYMQTQETQYSIFFRRQRCVYQSSIFTGVIIVSIRQPVALQRCESGIIGISLSWFRYPIGFTFVPSEKCHWTWCFRLPSHFSGVFIDRSLRVGYTGEYDNTWKDVYLVSCSQCLGAYVNQSLRNWFSLGSITSLSPSQLELKRWFKFSYARDLLDTCIPGQLHLTHIS